MQLVCGQSSWLVGYTPGVSNEKSSGRSGIPSRAVSSKSRRGDRDPVPCRCNCRLPNSKTAGSEVDADGCCGWELVVWKWICGVMPTCSIKVCNMHVIFYIWLVTSVARLWTRWPTWTRESVRSAMSCSCCRCMSLN